MTRWLPRFDWGGWGGGSLDRPERDVRGGAFVIQWLGVLIEIGVGRVKP